MSSSGYVLLLIACDTVPLYHGGVLLLQRAGLPRLAVRGQWPVSCLVRGLPQARNRNLNSTASAISFVGREYEGSPFPGCLPRDVG